MDIVIIGSGNVASAMGREFLSAGHRIVQVFSRNREHAETLALVLKARPISSPAAIETGADLILIAISDNAYASFLSSGFPPTDSFLVHTAGSVPLSVFKNISSRYGVLYPLQSFRIELETLTKFPLLIDANSEKNLQALKELAEGLGHTIIHANDDMRLKYHLAAVLLNNFSNHLFAVTEGWCNREGIRFSLLHPLIQETSARLALALPQNLQTGPAIRNDTETLERHRKLLGQFPELLKLYDSMTRSIQEFHRIQ